MGDVGFNVLSFSALPPLLAAGRAPLPASRLTVKEEGRRLQKEKLKGIMRKLLGEEGAAAGESASEVSGRGEEKRAGKRRGRREGMVFQGLV